MKVQNSVIDFRSAEKRGLLDADLVAQTETVATKPRRDAHVTEASVEQVRGIGPGMARKLEKLGITTIGDLAVTKAAFPLEACFNPRESAALVGLRAGLAKTLRPRPAVEPLPAPRAPDAARSAAAPTSTQEAPSITDSPWARRELASAPRNADGSIPTYISTGINKWGWYDGYTVNMSDVQYIQHRKEQEDHAQYLHELHHPRGW